MGLMDRVKQQASALAQQANESMAKLDNLPAQRRADALLRSLGVAVLATKTGRATGDTEDQITKILADIAQHEQQYNVDLVAQAAQAAAQAAQAQQPWQPGPPGQPGQPWQQGQPGQGWPGQPGQPGQPMSGPQGWGQQGTGQQGGSAFPPATSFPPTTPDAAPGAGDESGQQGQNFFPPASGV